MTENTLRYFLEEWNPDIYFEDDGNIYLSIYYFLLDEFTGLLTHNFYDERKSLPAEIYYDNVLIKMNDILEFYFIPIDVLKKDKQ